LQLVDVSEEYFGEQDVYVNPMFSILFNLG